MSQTIITILSDLGTGDTAIAMAKATLMHYVPDAEPVTISTGVAAYDLQQAAYLLSVAYPHFPKGTLHLAIVDVLSGAKPRMLLAQKDGYYFIAADNGLLPLALGPDTYDTWLAFESNDAVPFPEWMQKAAEVAQRVVNGAPPDYPICSVLKKRVILQPVELPDGMECNVLFIDRFGNVVLDLKKGKFDERFDDGKFTIRLMRLGDITMLSSHYNDVELGKPLCRFNNAGYLEIAVNHGHAASLLGLNTADTAALRYRTIKLLAAKTS